MKKYLLIALAGMLFACASPEKKFEKGNYQSAFNGALKELTKGKRGKNKDILNRSFREILKQHNSQYALDMRSGQVRDWASAFNDRNNIIEDYIKAKRWLSDDFDRQIEIYEEEQIVLAQDITGYYEDMADNSMELFFSRGDKIAAQEAFAHYQNAIQFDDDNDTLVVKLNQALEAGTIHILFEADSWDFRYEYEIDRTFKDVERKSGGFLQVYFEENIPSVDCRIEIDFNSLDIDVGKSTEVKEFSKRIKDGTETVIDTSGKRTEVDKYITVTGSVVIVTEIKKYDWEARSRVNQMSEFCDFRTRSFNTAFIDEIEYYDLSGDQRAIPFEYKTTSQEKFIDEDNVVGDLIDDIYHQVIRVYF
ncbi:MAG: hypothetical protein HKO66_15360 [Saprospiraceae bacterium]|nr:hypothetical protein [Bacteroidia bacterium]NNE13528.1 hypothetical protein [Saprospiraceae bacterium]NNL93619.1 hypothetical protein [Saprospiraceae bacterium]